MTGTFTEIVEFRRLIHSDIDGAAHWHLEVAEDKIARGAGDGVGYDIMASLILHAFFAESVLNFVGSEVLGDEWPERARFEKSVVGS